MARDKTLPVATESKLDCITGVQVTNRHRVIHVVSTEKQAINRVNPNEAEFFTYGLHKPVEPASVVRDERGRNFACCGVDSACCESPGSQWASSGCGGLDAVLDFLQKKEGVTCRPKTFSAGLRAENDNGDAVGSKAINHGREI